MSTNDAVRMRFQISSIEIEDKPRSSNAIEPGSKILYVPDGVSLDDHVAAIRRGDVQPQYATWPPSEDAG